MNFREVVDYIEGSMRFGCRPGLERTARLLELLGNPHKAIKFIHVAGTNGKGSTTSMIANTLKCAGYKTGMYISPHLYTVTERMTINGERISEEDFTSYALQIIEKIDYMKQNNMEEPTQFEMLTAMAFMYFREKNVDFVVVEVGLGGLYDATNVVEALVNVITSISYDHMDILGDTIEKIAAEKAGIIKSNSVAVLYPQQYEAADRIVEEACLKSNSTLVRVGSEFSKPVSFSTYGQVFDYNGNGIHIKDIRLPLLGDHQLKNAAVAVTALFELQKMGYTIQKEIIKEGLETVDWPCRLSIVSQEPLILIDGAHNEDGVNTLRDALQKYFHDKKIIFVIGMLKDKNYQYALEQLMPLGSSVIASEPVSPRALTAEEMKGIVGRYCDKVLAEPDIKKAVELAKAQWDKDSVICICGSLYLAGSALEYLTI